jgi:hypothetical protein
MEKSELQNSAAGFYIFASDATAPATGLAGLAGSIVTALSKNGGNASAVAPTITQPTGMVAGVYWVAPIAAHRDTLGRIAWSFSAAGAIIAPRLEKIVAANDQVAAFGANTVTPPTLAQMEARTLPSADYFDPETDGVNVTEVGGNAVAGPNDLKADVSSLPTLAQMEARTLPSADYFDPETDGVNVTEVGGTAVAGPNDLKADVTGIASDVKKIVRSATELPAGEGRLTISGGQGINVTVGPVVP